MGRLKLFGKNEDGKYDARIEQIETSKEYDILNICNRKPNLWILSLLSGYRQIGQYIIKRGHNFKEGQLVTVQVDDGTISSVDLDHSYLR